MIKTFIFTILMLVSTVTSASGFVNLVNDDAIRANNGDITVTVNVRGYQELLLDGEPVDLNLVSNGFNVSYVISNVDRGTHTLTLVTDSGEETITIHVLRVHK